MTKQPTGVEKRYLFEGEQGELRGRMAYNKVLKLKQWWGDGHIEYNPCLLVVQVPGGPLVVQIRNIVTELGGREV